MENRAYIQNVVNYYFIKPALIRKAINSKQDFPKKNRQKHLYLILKKKQQQQRKGN